MKQSAEIVKELMDLKHVKKLWPAQERAIEQGLLQSGENFVIIAPTSSGKTFVAELAMLEALKDKKRVLYLLPSHALVSEKASDFKYLTKRYRISYKQPWSKADIVISTFENFYRTSLLNPNAVKGFGLAVVDEFHVLYDRLRGFNLEKAITMLKLNKTRILCLSATFEDRTEVAKWLDARLVEVPEELRQVKLQEVTWDFTANGDPMGKVYERMLSLDLKPCLIFCNTKDASRSRAVKFSQTLGKGSALDQVAKDVAQTLGREELTALEIDLVETLARGVGFHHSGLDNRLKSLVEERFRSRHLNYLFSTTGLAYGVNFPVKSVIICDLTFWDVESKKQINIPVYLYIQMAGRAGRPQFGTEGYVVTIAKTTGDEARAKDYQGRQLEKATSQIVNDDYFRKSILELVYADRRTDDQIMEFFKATFFNHQGEHGPEGLAKFDLEKIVKRQVEFLQNAGFLTYLGGAGFKLTDLGKVTLDFLFSTYGQYELAPFRRLDEYLEETKEVKVGFEIVHKVAREFPQTNLARTVKDKPRDIVDFFEKRGVEKLSGGEYTAYAVYFGWMQNLREDLIEADYKVYASQIRDTANELVKLMGVYEMLATNRSLKTPAEFHTLKERLEHGVREEELPFVKLSGIERNTVRSLYDFGRETLSRPPFGFKGTLIEQLTQHYKKFGERESVNLLSGSVRQIGPTRAQKIVNLIETKAKTAK